MKDKDELKIERSIVEKAKTDMESFGILYDMYVDDVFRFVYYKISNKEEAEDITAKTFEKALRAIKRFKWKGYSFKTWLFVIAKNIVIDTFKAKKINISIEQLNFDIKDEENSTVEESLELNMNRKELLNALSKLTDEHKEILILRYIEDLSIKEVMQISGKTMDSVKSLTKRALQRLKEVINN
ncbi:sigma-70 family RNA polymerase sigma factor [Candidatus Dojkabacteria bacterium]|nr:sigma-70 family RNA polymerase sigma factor [Candidatus Dojkabacteria bacterium]